MSQPEKEEMQEEKQKPPTQQALLTEKQARKQQIKKVFGPDAKRLLGTKRKMKEFFVETCRDYVIDDDYFTAEFGRKVLCGDK